MRLTTFTLFDCSRPMKCQRNGVAVDGVLRLEVLGAVLAHDLDPGLERARPISASGTYFVAATIVTAGPDLGRSRA